MLIARVVHLSDDMTGTIILPLKDYNFLLTPANEGWFRMIEPYEKLVLQLLNSKSFKEPKSLYAEIQADMATLLSERNDGSITETLLLRVEEIVDTQATKKPRSEENTNP